MAKVAVVQEPPVYLDLAKSIDRAVAVIADCADTYADYRALASAPSLPMARG